MSHSPAFVEPIKATACLASDRSVRDLNQTDLSRRWNISPRSLEGWRWLKQGPRYLKIGGRVMYRFEDIEVYEATKIRKTDHQPSDVGSE